ncbi:MAG TPA: acyl-ACP desaturase [Bacteriovoracaceae bacterium]|nr:acyl-ACP desaturase [Bacteriovoracaceae bacterium]
MEIDRYLSSSAKVDVEDLDWELARKVGLTKDEVFILTYFADIEGQTIVYLRDILHTKSALDPEVIGFLSMWNYEEYFHGRALSTFLEVCGHPLEKERIKNVRSGSKISEKLEVFFSGFLSRMYSDQFTALYMSWGAIQEATTLCGYEQISKTTKNPVLKILVDRIAKQERRHFAWYFNSARERLEQSRSSQKLTRLIMGKFWSPVGAGVKPDPEIVQLMLTLFPDDAGIEMTESVDSKISSLPGLSGMTLMGNFIQGITSKKLPAHAREMDKVSA